MIRLPGITIITNEAYDAKLGMQEMYKRLAITRGEEVMKLEEIYCTEAKEYNLQVQRGERLAKDLAAVQAEYDDLDRRYVKRGLGIAALQEDYARLTKEVNHLHTFYADRVRDIAALQAENARLRMTIDSIKESIERTRV